MIKDYEGISRIIIGFSKNPIKDGEHVQVDYKLKPLDVEWLRKIFNVNIHNANGLERSLEDKNYEINKQQYDLLKPYIIGDSLDFNKYDFYLDTGGASLKKWDWRSGYPIQIKNADMKLKPYYTDVVTDPILQSYIVAKGQKTLAIELESNYWDEFYEYIRDNYPFTELSIYRIDWDIIKDHKFLSMEQAISSPAKVREFLNNTCMNQFKEVVIAYGHREPVILIPLQYIFDYPLENLFDQEWGACFIIGANRDKYGMIKLVKECFVEVDCDEGLVVKIHTSSYTSVQIRQLYVR